MFRACTGICHQSVPNYFNNSWVDESEIKHYAFDERILANDDQENLPFGTRCSGVLLYHKFSAE
jgi:hypothetical protein